MWANTQNELRGMTGTLQVLNVKLFFFFNLFTFNWRISALQYCVGFWHVSTWISHGYTHIPSLCPAFLPPHPSPLGYNRAPVLTSLCQAVNFHWLPILHMVMYMFQCYSLNSSRLLLRLLCPQACSPFLYLHCRPPDRFITAILLNSIHVC